MKYFSLNLILAKKDNNYSKIQKSFRKKTGMNIMRGYNFTMPLTKKISIIIPFYSQRRYLKYCLNALKKQVLPINFNRKNIEIIIINDGARVSPMNKINQIGNIFNLTYIELKKNLGRAAARNIGLAYSRNEIILFLDADTIPNKNFLISYLIRHEFVKNCIFVGCRENISFNNFLANNLSSGFLKNPDFKKDFRHKKLLPQEWINQFCIKSKQGLNKIYYLLKNTDYFKYFGRGKVIGVWELPFMFLACNASVLRKDVIEVGGFDERFKGWGLEDTHLGAKLIAKGLYLIPNLSATAYHLVPKITPKKESEGKNKSFIKNLRLYQKLKNEPLVLFQEKEWVNKKLQQFSDKISKIYQN